MPNRRSEPRDEKPIPGAERAWPRALPLRPPRIFTYVDAVARYGSIRKAAESLHVVSSALNRRILDLEEELGSPLFERLPRGVRPTAAGELFVDYVRRSMRELEQVGAQIEELNGLLRGRVRIAVAESVTGHLLPRAVARFQAAHPNVCFHVWVDGPVGLTQALLSDSADLILTHEPNDHPEVHALAQVHQTFCALMPASHPLAKRSGLYLHDCLEYPIALPDESLAARRVIDRALRSAQLQLEPALVSNSVELTKIFARQNQAICFQFRVGDTPEPYDLVEVPLLDDCFTQGRLMLAMRRMRVLPVAAATFAEQLEEELTALVQTDEPRRAHRCPELKPRDAAGSLP
jgi:DNA-binding transcriptional LysR family regulator